MEDNKLNSPSTTQQVAANTSTPANVVTAAASAMPSTLTSDNKGGKNMLVWVVAGVLVVLLLGLAGTYFYLQNQQPTAQTAQAPTPQPTPESLDAALGSINLGDEETLLKDVDTELSALQ